MRIAAALLTAGLAFSAFQAAPAAARPGTFALQRADGTMINYRVDRHGRRGRQPVLLLLQGSGCEPVATDARVIGYGSVLAPDHALLTVEKYGVSRDGGSEAAVDGCSPDYWRGNSLSRRVLDALQVIAKLRGERWWNRRITIFGGSEGGAVAAMLAPLVPEAKAVIVYSSGIGVPVGELIRLAIPPPYADQAAPVFAQAKLNPTGEQRWGGASYAWWADAVDMVPARGLLQVRAPILLIHGGRDQFAPVATARATRDLLARAGRRNFTYREYEAYDHFMTDAAGVDHRHDVLADAGKWLRRL